MTETVIVPEKKHAVKKASKKPSKMKIKKNDNELPFTFMLVTIMSSCGISPYESFRRLRSITLFPFTQGESSEIVRQVEVLNKDPLSAMLRRADETESRLYGDSLRGYVSTVQSGGSVASYFKSRLRSIFDIQAEAAVRSIVRLETLVEAYMVMLIVLLCTYILLSVTSSASLLPDSLGLSFGSPILVYAILFLVMPSMSLLFMLLAHIVRRSTIMGLRRIYYKAVPAAVASILLLVLYLFVPQLKRLINSVGPPVFTTLCLIAISLLPMVSYRKIIGLNLRAEDAMPSFLRDVSEARKTGMTPEKSIVHGAKRKGYGSFSKVLERIVSQIEWGVSLRKIYEDVKDRIQSWPVLANFIILIETIEVGGGSPEALEQLADYSEKFRDIEKNKREMLKPYVMLPFIWSILMSLTFVFTFFVVAQMSTSITGHSSVALSSEMGILSSALVLQCWLSGFFVGKVVHGTFSAGFLYSILLAATSLGALIASQRIASAFLGAVVL
jgi:flagellar protein FlaJ